MARFPIRAPGRRALQFWPLDDRSDETVGAFVQAFATLGYGPCEQPGLEPGFEKIALYSINGRCKHAARQLEDGRWTSKLGRAEDISHELHALEGDLYGVVTRIMRRPRPISVGARTIAV